MLYPGASPRVVEVGVTVQVAWFGGALHCPSVVSFEGFATAAGPRNPRGRTFPGMVTRQVIAALSYHAVNRCIFCHRNFVVNR